MIEGTMSDTGALSALRIVIRASSALLAFERIALMGLMYLLTGLVVVFGVALVITCVLWMDPIGLARAGFDGRKLAAETFNFLYTEHTQTLNWPTWVLYLTLPIFAVSMTVHGLANLLEDLELVP